MVCVSLQWNGIRSPFDHLAKKLAMKYKIALHAHRDNVEARGLLENSFPHGVLLQKENFTCVSGIPRQGQWDGSYLHILQVRQEHLFWDWFWIQMARLYWRESEEVKSEHWLANATDSTPRVLSLISHRWVILSCKKVRSFCHRFPLYMSAGKLESAGQELICVLK